MKMMNFALHASSFIEFCHNNYIPRGLCIKKRGMLLENKEFKMQWISILNNALWISCYFYLKGLIKKMNSWTLRLQMLLMN